MTLLQIVQGVATNVGLEKPVSAQTDNPDNEKMVRFVNETGLDMRRRVDWTSLTKSLAIASFDGDGFADLADDHDRFIPGLSVKANDAALRGSLSADEWNSLPATTGTPRFYRVTGSRLGFFPKPSPGITGSVAYQSSEWALDETNLGVEEMTRDTDEPLIPSELLIKGAVWRFQRHAGRDFSDHMAEYEAMLADLATAEGGVRQP